MLKLFAIFLKTENPANTAYMREKYHKKMQKFLEKCTVPIELSELAEEKGKLETANRESCFLTLGFACVCREEKEEANRVSRSPRKLKQVIKANI